MIKKMQHFNNATISTMYNLDKKKKKLQIYITIVIFKKIIK